jgi:hypothetical protein
MWVTPEVSVGSERQPATEISSPAQKAVGDSS